jgi:predicted Rossmann fold flavoprotein
MLQADKGMHSVKKFDVIIVGAGAAGLMCAIEAGKNKKSVLILEGANKPGKKILMSGGGFCNFTNKYIHPDCYISHNKHFCKSALSRYGSEDFLELVKQYKIAYHEKTLGQLFCDHKAKEILQMLLDEANKYQVSIALKVNIEHVKKLAENSYTLNSSIGKLQCQSLVIASGGVSIPSLGASAFGYEIAKQFALKVWPIRPGLVPFTLHTKDKEKFSLLSGLSFYSKVSNKLIDFKENCLFTHRGMSGPAILQISSYWQPGECVQIDVLPEHCVATLLTEAKNNKLQKNVKTLLSQHLPKRFVEQLLPSKIQDIRCSSLSTKDIAYLVDTIHHWRLQPNATEGYRTAEVTLGGVDCAALSSKTMESIAHKGLYFIGEVVDVTGWLGGYNFQWAWASGYAAGQYV